MKNFNLKISYVLIIALLVVTIFSSCSKNIDFEEKEENILDIPILDEQDVDLDNDISLDVDKSDIDEDESVEIEPLTPQLPLEEEVKPPKEDKPLLPQSSNKQYILIKTDNLNVRSGSGTKYSKICSFDKGDMLGYFGKENDWYITYVKGKKAYVSANHKYTEIYNINASSDKIEKVIDIGLKYLGTPYVYGAVRYHDGNGKKLKNFTETEFDCSSYMQYIFFNGNNVLLGLTTRNQILQGKHIEKKDIRRGDLLFFTNASRYNKKGIERVGHVALYLGNNYILHTASDYAVIEQISNQRWNYYIEARRFI